MRTMILVNPKAREGQVGEKWPELERQLLGALGDGEARVEFTSVEDHGAGTVRRALRDGVERVVVVGGDGTISEAVQGFFGEGAEAGQAVAPQAVLGVMPAGRGDDFFKVLAGGRCKSSAEAWQQGLDLLKRGQPAAADVGRVSWIAPSAVAADSPGTAASSRHDRAFINLASFGYPGLVVKRVNEHAGFLGRNMGKSGWAYLAQIATGLAQYRPIRTEVRVDGETVFDGPLFSGFVLNGYYNAGGMRWSDEARIDDGVFNVVLSEPRNPISTALSGPRMLSGDWRGVKGIHIFKGRKVEVRPLEPVAAKGAQAFPFFEIDGEQPEPAGIQGAVFEVLPGAVRLWK